jgi:hypothetical protein
MIEVVALLLDQGAPMFLGVASTEPYMADEISPDKFQHNFLCEVRARV